MKRLLLVAIALVVLASLVAAGSSCKLTGNGRKTACVCRVGNHWHGAPMWRCQ